MVAPRVGKVAERIKQEISVIIREELKDPRIGFVTITHVDVTADLQHARVHVSCLGTPEEKRSSVAGLTSATPFVRRLIGERITLRYTPEIVFALDESLEQGLAIQRTLDTLKEQAPRADQSHA